jgi:hypothetical protein
MKRIEQGLAEIHSDFVGPNGEGPSVVVPLPAAAPYSNGHSSASPTSEGDAVNLNEPGFATVGQVQSGSPADMDVSELLNIAIVISEMSYEELDGRRSVHSAYDRRS